MYIDFYGYPPYSGAISESFKANIISHIQCDHCYPYSSIKDNMLTWINEDIWEITQKCFPDAKEVNKCPKIKMQKCIYVQNEINKIDESFDLPPYNEHTFTTSYFL